MSEYLGVKIEILAQLITALGVLFVIWRRFAQAKADLADEVIARLKAAKASESDAPPVEVKSPLEVRHEDPPIRRSEHVAMCGHMERRVSALEARTHAIERKMEVDKNEILAAGEARAIALHERINTIDKGVAAIDERSEVTQAELRLLNQNVMAFLREARR